MFGLGLIPAQDGVVHLLVSIVFDILIIGMLVWMLLSWFMMMMPISPGNRFVRFVDALVSPLTDPIRKRIPSASMGMLNVSYTVAFIFAWWALRVLAFVIIQGLPGGW
ncbi:MAG TPA: YggT family protein [Ktedonobacterales bacterium]|jgi:uncharacterized protein YggT (Ycf19 family)|nr:YggT family protein [Ktedonobacterales bacterium]